MVIGLSGWVTYARILRSQVLVAALARVRGGDPRARRLGRAAIVLRHILPNVLSSLVVIATLELARAIVLEATLSFLGLGIQPPTPSWGGMVHEGREYLDSAWWISTFPGLVLMLTSLVVSRTGDWLRDLLDPTLRGNSAMDVEKDIKWIGAVRWRLALGSSTTWHGRRDVETATRGPQAYLTGSSTST